MTPDYQRLFQSAPGLYLVLDAELTIVAASDAYLRATMTQREGIIGRRLFEVFPDNPEDPAATGAKNLAASLGRVLQSRRADAMAVQKYDISRPESEGGGFEERYWSPLNCPVLDDHGRVEYIIHRVEDVTEFVRLKQERLQEHRVAEGWKLRSEAMEADVLRRAQQIQDANRELRELQAELESRVEERTRQLKQANADLSREMSEREQTSEALRQSEEQLRQAQKLEAVGRLAGGVAHDFNNLLTAILSYSEFLLQDLEADAPGRSEIEEIRRAGQRAAALTSQLLAFSRQQIAEPRILDLNEVIEGLRKILTRLLGEDIEVRARPASELGKVKADPGQVEQVIMNLAVNARDAMPNGGVLTIETANVELDEGFSSEQLAAGGLCIMLAVSDNGVGMDAATRARIFEPFYTTKAHGKGTGLGLSTVYGIVKQCGGSIWVYSEPGSGTTFKIYLPRVEDQIADARPVPLDPAHVRGTETVLLVEDEDQVREVAARILRNAGYRVLQATNPIEALSASEQHPERLHLLLTDVIMPKMNGRQLANQLSAKRPGMKILFMSGYTDDVVLQHGILDAGVAMIQKPLTPSALARKVRQVLDQA